MNEPRAQCACLTVEFRTAPHDDGTVTGHWYCATPDGCGREFVPRMVFPARVRHIEPDPDGPERIPLSEAIRESLPIRRYERQITDVRKAIETVVQNFVPTKSNRHDDEQTLIRLIQDAIHPFLSGALYEQLSVANAEAEQLLVQLAGCGVAALGGTSEDQVAKRGDYGWSQSYQDVLDLRIQHDRWVYRIKELERRNEEAAKILQGAWK